MARPRRHWLDSHTAKGALTMRPRPFSPQIIQGYIVNPWTGEAQPVALEVWEARKLRCTQRQRAWDAGEGREDEPKWRYDPTYNLQRP